MNSLIVLCIVAMAFAEEKSECQLHREREQARNDRDGHRHLPGALVPECEEDGSYKGLQCHPRSMNGRRFCHCWDEEGLPLAGPSTNLIACECIREKTRGQTRQAQGDEGVFVPDCKPNGTYAKKQCSGSPASCWCADEAGTKLTEPTTGEVICD